MYKEEELIELFYTKRTVIVLFKGIEVAKINESVVIDLEFINELRSENQKKELLKKISECVGSLMYSDSEVPEERAFETFLSALSLNNDSINKVKEEDKTDFLRALNTLVYTYNNMWYESRQSQNSWVYECFENSSDAELDLIVSLIIMEETKFVKDFIKKMSNTKLVNETDFNETAKLMKSQNAPSEDDPVHGCFFKNWDDVIKINKDLELYNQEIDFNDIEDKEIQQIKSKEKKWQNEKILKNINDVKFF